MTASRIHQTKTTNKNATFGISIFIDCQIQFVKSIYLPLHPVILLILGVGVLKIGGIGSFALRFYLRAGGNLSIRGHAKERRKEKKRTQS